LAPAFVLFSSFDFTEAAPRNPPMSWVVQALQAPIGRKGTSVAARRSRRSPRKQQREAPREGVHSAPLEPIRVVERELTCPDGTTLRVKVPVYPPFRLREPAQIEAEAKAEKKAS
jgi:hypothetical protein